MIIFLWISFFPVKRSIPFITEANSQFGSFIEGVAVDPSGNIYATNFLNQARFIGTVLNVTNAVEPSQLLFASIDDTAKFNGIRFMNKDLFYAVDSMNKRVLRFVRSGAGLFTGSTYCTSPAMLDGTPNDLTISKSGLLYLSGQMYKNNGSSEDGQIWLCKPNPSNNSVAIATLLATSYRTNGIELSLDQKSLYVSEASTLNGVPINNVISKYNINSDGTLGRKILFIDFNAVDNSSNIDIDGMRIDNVGNLYVTRNGGQRVSVFNPSGQLVNTISTTFSNVASLEFGGIDGKTLFMVGRCGINSPFGSGKGCVDTFVNNIPGRAWQQVTTSTASKLSFDNFMFLTMCLLTQ